MKAHQILFDKTHELLKRYLGNRLTFRLECYDDGYKESHLSITESEVWLSCDDKEITIGEGVAHKHYIPEYDSMIVAVDHLISLLCYRKKITAFYKGGLCYKKRIVLEGKASQAKSVTTTSTRLFTFWKPKEVRVFYEEAYIDKANFLVEMNEIKNTLYNGM